MEGHRKEVIPLADNELLRAYLVVGSDEYKRSKVIGRLRERLERTGMADFNIDERDMSGDPAVDDVVASLNTLPMGSDFRLVILRGCERLPKAVSEPIIAYLDDPSETTVCLVVAEKLARNTRLYKAIAKFGARAIVDCTPKSAKELPPVVMKMVRARGADISPQAAQELVDRVGDSSRMLENVVERLVQIVSNRRIETEDVELNVARTAEATPWQLLDAVSARDLPSALEQLELQPANNEILLYTLLVGRLRELIVAKSLDGRGAGREVASALRMPPNLAWKAKKLVAWSRKFTMDELLAALDGACDLELALKGSRDSALALRLWIVGLAR